MWECNLGAYGQEAKPYSLSLGYHILLTLSFSSLAMEGDCWAKFSADVAWLYIYQQLAPIISTSHVQTKLCTSQTHMHACIFFYFWTYMCRPLGFWWSDFAHVLWHAVYMVHRVYCELHVHARVKQKKKLFIKKNNNILWNANKNNLKFNLFYVCIFDWWKKLVF